MNYISFIFTESCHDKIFSKILLMARTAACLKLTALTDEFGESLTAFSTATCCESHPATVNVTS